MKQAVFPLLLAMVLTAGCQPKKETISASRRDAIIDSLVGIRVEEMNRQSMEDLDRRRSIEVKAKADSILAAGNKHEFIEGNAPADNTIPNELPMP